MNDKIIAVLCLSLCLGACGEPVKCLESHVEEQKHLYLIGKVQIWKESPTRMCDKWEKE